MRKLAANSVAQRTAALRFLFVKTLKRHYMLEHIPFPKIPLRLPTVLSQEEVTRMIDAAPNLLYRTILMILYSTGMRRGEVVQLRAADIDKERMLVHIREGKGRRDRDVPLSPKLLDALREYWRWMRPVTYVFPGVVDGHRVDVPFPTKSSGTLAVWRHNAPASPSTFTRIRCATATPRTCSKPAPICRASRNCSAMPTSATPSSICTCPVSISAQSPTRSMNYPSCLRPPYAAR